MRRGQVTRSQYRVLPSMHVEVPRIYLAKQPSEEARSRLDGLALSGEAAVSAERGDGAGLQ